MASFGFHHLSLFSVFLFHLLLLSPQSQAREGKFMTFFSHFTTHNNVKDPQFVVVVPNKIKPHPHPHSPSPAPSPTESQVPSPSPSILAPEPAQEEAEFVDRGDGYGLYGTTTTFENDNNDKKKKETFKTSFPNTRFYSNNNNINNEDDDVYRNNYNNNNNNNNYYNTPRSTNIFDQDSFYANNNNNYYSNYERKGEGMSDTRLMEDGKYFYDIKGENQNYDNYYKAEDHTTRGSTKYYNNNGGNYYVKNNYNKYPNEFDTMEEYEKQQESQGYVP